MSHASNISEEQLAEVLLAEFHASRIGRVVLDLQGVVIRHNDAAVKVHGDQMKVGANLVDLLAEEDQAKHMGQGGFLAKMASPTAPDGGAMRTRLLRGSRVVHGVKVRAEMVVTVTKAERCFVVTSILWGANV